MTDPEKTLVHVESNQENEGPFAEELKQLIDGLREHADKIFQILKANEGKVLTAAGILAYLFKKTPPGELLGVLVRSRIMYLASKTAKAGRELWREKFDQLPPDLQEIIRDGMKPAPYAFAWSTFLMFIDNDRLRKLGIYAGIAASIAYVSYLEIKGRSSSNADSSKEERQEFRDLPSLTTEESDETEESPFKKRMAELKVKAEAILGKHEAKIWMATSLVLYLLRKNKMGQLLSMLSAFHSVRNYWIEFNKDFEKRENKARS